MDYEKQVLADCKSDGLLVIQEEFREGARRFFDSEKYHEEWRKVFKYLSIIPNPGCTSGIIEYETRNSICYSLEVMVEKNELSTHMFKNCEERLVTFLLGLLRALYHQMQYFDDYSDFGDYDCFSFDNFDFEEQCIDVLKIAIENGFLILAELVIYVSASMEIPIGFPIVQLCHHSETDLAKKQHKIITFLIKNHDWVGEKFLDSTLSSASENKCYDLIEDIVKMEKNKEIEMNLKKHFDEACKNQRYDVASILASGQREFCKVVINKNASLETADISEGLTVNAHAYLKKEEDKAEQKKRKMKIKNIEMNLKNHVDKASKTQRYKIASFLAFGQDFQVESEELTNAKQRIATLENKLRLTSVKVEIKDEPMEVDNSIKREEQDLFDNFEFEDEKPVIKDDCAIKQEFK